MALSARIESPGDDLPGSLGQAGGVGRGQAGGRHGGQNGQRYRAGVEDDRALRQAALRAGDRDRYDVHARFDREAEGAFAEPSQSPVGTAGPLGEEEYGDSAAEPAPKLFHRVSRALLVSADDRDVTGHPQLPAEQRDLEQRALEDELHLPGQADDS